jgi:hypothetical protein
MGLFRAIVGGFGFQIGARAADEMLDGAEKALDDHDKEKAKAKAEAETHESQKLRVESQINAMAKEAEARKKAQARREKEVEKELGVLKKRLAIEAKESAKKR